MFQKIRVDLDLRVLIIFSKKETVCKVESSPNVESLHYINILKTMYKKQEKSQERYEQIV